ncbi:hypothetical protein RRG08_055637 [Elysia crispata]|uniref:Uncharacterized protein n=1 Tax=Elysia crispata TaxID=231223 RepID=A0AAE0Z9P7_9GAST|nr:hypothetical protein RRG08_055637 [Elysia crispata]
MGYQLDLLSSKMVRFERTNAAQPEKFVHRSLDGASVCFKMSPSDILNGCLLISRFWASLCVQRSHQLSPSHDNNIECKPHTQFLYCIKLVMFYYNADIKTSDRTLPNVSIDKFLDG